MKTLVDAAKSDWSTSIATIAGGKAHRISTRTLLEDAEVERFNYRGKPAGKETIKAGTTLYYSTTCGTQRHAKWGMTYQNQYQPADEVTCIKCGAAEVKNVVTAKVGPKWTYIFVDGEQVAEVRTGYHEPVMVAIKDSL